MGLFSRNRGTSRNTPPSQIEIDRICAASSPIGNAATSYIVARTITDTECFWLSEPIKKGSVVHRFTGNTYGNCATEKHAIVSRVPHEYPFFEIPQDALISLRGLEC